MPTSLVLEITSDQARYLGPLARAVVSKTPFQIGRSPSSDWVLNEETVSRDQARITGHAGLFFLDARGSQPTILNGKQLANNEPNTLRSGDLISFAEFSIRVREATSEDVSKPESPASPVLKEPKISPRGRSDAGSLDKFLGSDKKSPQPKVRPGPDLDVADEVLGVPSPISQGPIPPDFLDRGGAPTPSPGDPRSREAAPSIPVDAILAKTSDHSGDSFGSALEAAGLMGAIGDKVHPEEFGAALRASVDGLIALLSARTSVKREMRLSRTEWQPAGNNPLKLSQNSEEALPNLFGAGGPDVMRGKDAFEDAFEDLSAHQFAMVKAMGVAFNNLLSTFDPARIEQSAGGKSSGAIAGFGGKGRLWDQYVEEYGRFTADPDDAFRRLFLDAFARAYEEEVARAKSASPRSAKSKVQKRSRK